MTMGNPQPSPKSSDMDSVHRLNGDGVHGEICALKYSRSHLETDAWKRMIEVTLGQRACKSKEYSLLIKCRDALRCSGPHA